jgi:hypothetical protein
MSKGALIDWKVECETIQREMDHLLKGRWLETSEERRVRQFQFLALIERRDTAARKFLQVNST